MDALADNGALELCEGARDLEQQAAHRCGGVDVLLIEVEVDAGFVRTDGVAFLPVNPQLRTNPGAPSNFRLCARLVQRSKSITSSARASSVASCLAVVSL